MKTNLVLALLLLTMTGLSAQQSSIIENILINSVEEKVNTLQKLIGFDDEQAQQLRETELNFLQKVNKAEHCFLCNTKKRVEKLKQERDEKLQTILERDQYIKFHSIENNLLNENNQLWLR